jgi:phosphohistidine phosphatase
MAKTLIVARHGHAQEREDDFVRQLSPQGVAEVNAAGAALARAVRFDAVLTSAAPRAAQTAQLLAEQCAFDGALREDAKLYLAEPITILQRVCATPDHVETLLLVGHNPGLSTFLTKLSGQPHELRTAQVVHLRLDVNQWGEVSFD